jgi:hypothetical protein
MWIEKEIREYREIKTGRTKYIDMGHIRVQDSLNRIDMTTPPPPQKPKQMTDKAITIDVPEGYEIDKDKSTFEKIVFKSLNCCRQSLPETWGELKVVKGFYVHDDSGIYTVDAKTRSDVRNTWPTYEEAVASIALAQLCQLRDRYNDGWKPNWEAVCSDKYIIYYGNGKICKLSCSTISGPLAFKTAELRDEFLSNFRDLIEKAKPLL